MHSRYLLLPTMAVIAGIGAAQAADQDFQIHGFASQGYIRTHGELYEDGLYGRDTNSGTFEFNEFALSVMTSPIERLRIGVQLSAYDLGKYGNDKVGVDWAFGEYQIKTGYEWLEASFVAGRFKTGHGFYNDYRDLDVTRTQVFLPRSTYSTSFRDFFLAANGAQLNAKFDTPAAGRFSISGFIGTQNFDEDEGPIFDVFASPFNGATSQPVPGSTNTLTSFDKITLDRLSGGYLDWDSPVDGLRLKGSALYAHQWSATGTMSTTLPFTGVPPFGTGGTILTAVEIDVSHWFDLMTGFEYQWQDLTVASEVSSSYYTAIARVGALNLPSSMRTLGTYLSANYQMTFLPGALSRLSVYGAGMWDRATDTYSDAKSYTRSAAIALRYDIVDHFLIKAEFERVQETSTTAIHTYGNIFSLKTTFDF